MSELRNYLLNLNLTLGTESFIETATDDVLDELFSIEDVEDEGDFGNAKALYVERMVDAYKAIGLE